MSRSFLDILPLELRNLIYEYVLTSPTRCITLSRTLYHQRPLRYRIFTCDEGGSEEIRISFLRTCKQIHDEAKNILWVRNALDIEAFMQENSRDGTSIRKLHFNIRSQIRDVVMDMNMLSGATVQLPDGGEGLVLQRTFVELEEIATYGELRSITLKARDKFAYDPRLLRHLIFTRIMDLRRVGEPDNWPQDPNPQAGRMLYHEYLDVLKGAGGRDGYLSRMKRTLIIDTGHPTFKDPTGHPIRSIKASRGNPNEMLRELHDAWGGTIVVNGKTSHANGEVQMLIFAMHPNPSDAEDEYYYTEEIEAYLGAEQYVKLHPEHSLTNQQVLDKMVKSTEFWCQIVALWHDHRREELKAEALDHVNIY